MIRFASPAARAGILLSLTLSFGAGNASAAVQEWSDYRAKGEISIAIQDVNMSILVDQIYRRPSSLLVNLDVLGLKQSILMDGTVEQSYNPAQGILIETRYLNLDKATVNPMVAANLSLEELGRRIRDAKSTKTIGQETVLGMECDLLQLETKEIVSKLSPGGFLSGDKLAPSLGPTVKAWISKDYGVLLKVEIPGADMKPALTVSLSELKMNAGVLKEELRLTVPPKTRRVTVTSDLADPDWDNKLRASLRKAVEEKEKPAAK